MAKSQQTFSKAEKEKKRLQKRQEKEQKKEDRKVGSGKGKGLEEMIAYVDENGNITSTPPDPNRRRTVEQENIRIGVPRQAPPDPEALLRTGIVTFFNDSKGYGFIRDLETGQSVFVHVKALKQPLKEKDKVTFEVEAGPKGPSAVNVNIV
jgi:cold shock CspA family protein